MNEKNVDSIRSKQRPQSLAPVIDFKQFLVLVISNWQWLIASIIVCVLSAGVYLWRTPTKISVMGKMKIIDASSNSGSLSAGMAMLNSLPMGLGSALGGSLGGSMGIDSEKEILTSNSLVRDVVKDLGLYVEYRHCEWGRKKLLYQDQPVIVSLDPAHIEWMDSELPLTSYQINLIISKNDKEFTIETKVNGNGNEGGVSNQNFSSLPATIKTGAGILTITENKALTQKQKEKYVNGYTLNVKIMPPIEAADGFIDNLKIDPPSKKITNMLNITLTDENMMRGIDFINHLVDVYNQRANDEKNEEARKTDEFVNSRIAKVDAELGSSDADWERYKKQFQITEPSVDAQDVMTKKSLYETELVEIGTQLQLHDYLNEYISDPANLYEIIPLSIGTNSASAKGGDNSAVSTQSAELIAQHNELVNQRRDYLKSMSDRAPQVLRVMESIKELQPVIKSAMKRDRQSILMKRSNVEREYGRYMGRVGNTPQQERVLTEIGRQREIKQGVYLVMLQKREETAIELANVADKGKLIDETRLVKNSAKPQKKMALFSVLVISVLFPLFVLYILKLIRNKVESRNDLESLSIAPVVGEVPLSNNDEAVRALRSNLLLNIKPDQKVIMVVSDSDGDGKTYIAKQLTDCLNVIGKKTLYFNADLRSINSEVSNGKHPADFFASDAFSKQILDAKISNDYVIMDTPALNRYNDANQIAPFTDAVIYVVKADETGKSAVLSIKDKPFPHLMFVLNAIDMGKKKNKYYHKIYSV